MNGRLELFTCDACKSSLDGRVFDICSEIGRVLYGRDGQVDEVDIEAAAAEASFCSAECRTASRMTVMARLGVDIPLTRPDIAPVEACAVCAGPVDMVEWHLTYIESVCEIVGNAMNPLGVEYLAVVCRVCAPDGVLLPESIRERDRRIFEVRV